MILKKWWFENDFISAEINIEVYTKYAQVCFPAMTTEHKRSN